MAASFGAVWIWQMAGRLIGNVVGFVAMAAWAYWWAAHRVLVHDHDAAIARARSHAERGRTDPALDRYRWMREEYRVSLFALIFCIFAFVLTIALQLSCATEGTPDSEQSPAPRRLVLDSTAKAIRAGTRRSALAAAREFVAPSLYNATHRIGIVEFHSGERTIPKPRRYERLRPLIGLQSASSLGTIYQSMQHQRAKLF